MKKKNLKKLLLAVCCAALLVCVSIGATVAYLTSAQKVVNTFTVGKVAITLDEAKVNTKGEEVNAKGEALAEGEKAPRVKDNTYKLLPGHTYTKDPTVHVAADSEDSWIFVKLEHGIQSYEAKDETADSADGKGYKNIAGQITTNGWEQLVGTDGNAVAGVYYKKYIQSNEAVDLQVFSNFKIAENANKTEGWDKTSTANITVTAYAIQADGFDTAAEAWPHVKDVTPTT